MKGAGKLNKKNKEDEGKMAYIKGIKMVIDLNLIFF